MTDLSKLTIHIGQLKSGEWIAATGSSPYFYVEAATEEGVKQLAKQAIGFYQSVLSDNNGTLPTQVGPFTSSITAGELVAA
jgi:predicted RNase H-like HicB family nuclease